MFATTYPWGIFVACGRDGGIYVEKVLFDQEFWCPVLFLLVAVVAASAAFTAASVAVAAAIAAAVIGKRLKFALIYFWEETIFSWKENKNISKVQLSESQHREGSKG